MLLVVDVKFPWKFNNLLDFLRTPDELPGYVLLFLAFVGEYFTEDIWIFLFPKENFLAIG